MNLTTIKKHLVLLKDTRILLIDQLTKMLSSLQKGLLVSSDATQEVEDTLHTLNETIQRLRSEIDDQKIWSDFSAIAQLEDWLQQKERESDIGKFLRITSDDPELDAQLVPYAEKVRAMQQGALQDNAFRDACLLFIDSIENGIDFNAHDFTLKTSTLTAHFGNNLYGLLCGQRLRMAPSQTLPVSAFPSENGKVSAVEKQSSNDIITDRHPIKLSAELTAELVLPDTLEISGKVISSFDKNAFVDTITRQQQAKKIITALSQFYVLSFEQLQDIVCIDKKRINSYLLDLSNVGYINKYRYMENESNYQMIYTIGACCTDLSAKETVAEYTDSTFVESPAALIRDVATSHFSCAKAAMQRSAFLRAVVRTGKDISLFYPDSMLEFGAVMLKTNRNVWFFAPFINDGEEAVQFARLKANLQNIPADDVVLIYVSNEELMGDWNIALADAKLSNSNIYYWTGTTLLRAHGLENEDFETVVFVGELPENPANSTTNTKYEPEPESDNIVIELEPELQENHGKDVAGKGPESKDIFVDNTKKTLSGSKEDSVEEATGTILEAKDQSEQAVPGSHLDSQNASEEKVPETATAPQPESDKSKMTIEVKPQSISNDISTDKEPDVETDTKPAPPVTGQSASTSTAHNIPGHQNSAKSEQTTTIDINKLPELKKRDIKVDQHNGIFKNAPCPGEDGNEADTSKVFMLLCKGVPSSALLYTRALSRCVPAIWKPLYDMLAYAYQDPLSDCDYSFTSIQAVFGPDQTICKAETRKRLELCAFLRMMFSDQLDMASLYLMKADVIRGELAGCDLLLRMPECNLLLEILGKFIQQYQKGFGVETTGKIRSADDLEVMRSRLQKRAQELLNMRLEECSSQHMRVKKLRETLFAPTGIMTQLLKPVSQGQMTNLEEVISFCRKYQKHRSGTLVIDEKKINELIDELWDKTKEYNSRQRNARLLDSQKIPIRNNITEIIQLCIDWYKISASECDKAVQYLNVRNQLLDNLDAIEAGISGSMGETRDLEDVATKMALISTIREKKEMLKGVIPTPEFFYIDFVTSNHVELDTETCLPLLDESVSIIPGYELWDRVLMHEKDKTDLSAFAKRALSGKCMREYDFGRQWILLRYLRSLEHLPDEITLENIAQLEDDITINVEAMPTEIQRMEGIFNAEMEMAEGYGRFVDLGTKDRILLEVREWHRHVADHTCNYGFYQRKLDAYCKAVDQESKLLKNQYIDKLNALRSSLPVEVVEKENNNILNTIEELIKARIYSVADDYMRLVEQGQTTPPVSYMRSGNNADYFEHFIDQYDALFHHYGYSAGKYLYDVYSSINRYDTNKIQKDARFMLKNWPRHDDNNREYGVRVLLQEFGFPVQDVTSLASIGNRKKMQITIQPSTSVTEYEHPIAEFGSHLEKDGFVVELYYGVIEPDGIMNIIRTYGSEGIPIIILLDYALGIDQRRTFAAMMKREGASTRTVILVDRILAVFLATVPKSERIKALLQCTLPFSFLIPYKIDDGGTIIPPDMFMGRRDELRSIRDSGGTHIIYGGRQLGKSALLHRARAQVDNRDEGNWGIYTSIQKKAEDEALHHICNVLIREQFLSEDCEAYSWTTLCELIYRRMNSKEKPIKRLLLLIDEADAFLKSCSNDSTVIDQLLNLQTDTENRFKFVLAGLHNVLRYSKNAIDNNTPINRLAPICIKPLKYSEGSELLEKPLFYLGFRMKPEHVALVSQILSSCNYYPGLIHYYAYQLLNRMDQNGGGNFSCPPYYLDEAQIRNLLQDPDFNKQIWYKLDMTLGVDKDEGNYYRILAYALAYCYHDNREKAAFGFSASELMHVCDSFDISSIVNQGEYTVQALLEEMEGMNVLRASRDKSLFSFNRRSFLEMLGDDETVWKTLEEFKNV